MSLLESTPLREWGTRYDTLSTSPSPSTTSSLSRINPPTTCTSTANSSLIAPVDATPTKPRAQGDRLSHEASVFVGSLPTNVDHAELSARLKDHLSAYVDVNLVRIIRDSRGGVCAFVQCNDSASAAQLIERVRSQPPQSFMGRYLRFEPARSQRTLWVSYRKPVEVICDPDHSRFVPSCNTSSRIVEFDLPKAMRICRNPGSRRISIFYNAHALHPDGNTDASLSRPLQEQDAAGSALTGVGLVLSPLRFDSQTLHQIASSFGPLESFDLHQPEPTVDSPEYPMYPFPHNTDRSECMDPGCWEIKWENRNDCLSALATLRGVPHLTVTWPNQQHALIPRRSGLFNRGHHVKDQLVPRRPSGLQHVQPRHGDENNVTSQNIPSFGSSSSWKHQVRTVTVTVGSPSSSEHLSPTNDGDLPVTTDDWTIVDPGNHAGFHVPPTCPDTAASKKLHVSQDHLCGAPFERKDKQERGGDEIPCIDEVPSSLSSNHLGLSEVASDNTTHPKGQVAALSPAPPLHAPAHAGNVRSPSPGPVNQQGTPFVENLASPFSPRSPRAVKPHVGGALDFYDTFAIPPAPQWSEARPRRHTGLCDENADVSLRNVFDPTTIFVGGLEVYGRCTWDEQRLKRVFGQYGEIVEVKLVRPAHRKSAFAFVTFKSNNSSARAVLAEHDRVYDGRRIRVQLRDNAVQKIQGSKSKFKSSGGRPFSPRHQIVNNSPVDTLPHIQTGVGNTIPASCEEPGPVLTYSPNSTASVHPDTRGHVPDNTCVPFIPSQASSTMVSGLPPMTYPPPPPAAFYAPGPWLMHPYPYVPPPHIVPGYSQIPLTPSVVSANEAGRPVPPGNMYQPIPHYSVYPLLVPPIPSMRQHHLELASVPERRAPLQPTGFIESEQGLIPVYAPEALGEYMASTNSHQNVPEPGGSHSVLHTSKAIPDTRSKATYAMHPQPQYHATFAGDRSAVMMAAPSQFSNAPNLVPGTGFDWYRDTTHVEYRPQEGPRAPAAQTIETYQGTPTGQPPRCQIYGERGFGFYRRRGQYDGPTFTRSGRSNNHPGTHPTRRRGYFKHTGGAVSMSAVTDETVESGKSYVDIVADAVVRASTSSPAVFDLTPTSPT